jgi:hypothetical protein
LQGIKPFLGQFSYFREFVVHAARLIIGAGRVPPESPVDQIGRRRIPTIEAFAKPIAAAPQAPCCKLTVRPFNPQVLG